MSLQEILNLPTAERLDVIEKIWDSIHKEHLEIPESQKKELDLRLNEVQDNKTQWLNLEKFKEQLNQNS